MFLCLFVEYSLAITGTEHSAHMVGLLRVTSGCVACDGCQCPRVLFRVTSVFPSFPVALARMDLMLEDVGMIAFLRWLQDSN
jgi:hypothetical protein